MKDLVAASPTGLAPHWDVAPRRDGDVDMRTLLSIIGDNKWFILVGTALFFLASVTYVLLARPTYQASALVQVEQSTASVPGQDASRMGDLPGSHAVTEIPLLTSRSLLGEAAANLNLDVVVEPLRLPVIGDFLARNYTPDRVGDVAPPRFGLERYGWGGEQVQVLRLDVPDVLLDVPLVLVAGEGGRYALRNGDGTTLLEGRVGRPSSAGGITMVVGALNANPGTNFMVQRRSRLATVTHLAENIQAVERGRDSGILALTYTSRDPALAVRVLDEVSSSYVERNIERNSAEADNSLRFVNEQLPKVRVELNRAQAALNAFQKSAGTVDIGLQTQALLNQSVSINGVLQQLRGQQPEIARRFTPEHPAYQALQQQIGQLQSEKASLQARINQLPDIQQGLYRLTRDVEVTNRTYTNLLDQAQQLDIARASAIGNVRVIDRPAVNVSKPIWPRALPIVGGLTTLGALLLTLFVIVRQMFNRGVDDAVEIERLGLPVYASILLSAQERTSSLRPGRHRRDLKPRLLALTAPGDLAMEALRGLRTSLHFARIEQKNNILMIAGASSGVGKTFVCSNLAVTMAQAGQRVLLIDADMRRGALHEVLGARSEDGLSELISGQIELDAAIRGVRSTENLFFISRGRVPPNPSELLMHPDFGALLNDLEPRFDLVIIDTPPVLAVTDAAVIGQHVGSTLLVVRFGISQSREIALARQRLEQSGVKVKGAIVNGVQRRASNHYAYSYYGAERA